MATYIVKKNAKIDAPHRLRAGEEIELTEAQYAVMSDLVETPEMANAMRALREKEARDAEAKSRMDADGAMPKPAADKRK